MSDSFKTTYVFELKVEGKAAADQARVYRQELDKILAGAVGKNAAAPLAGMDTAAKTATVSLGLLRDTVQGLSAAIKSSGLGGYAAELREVEKAAKSAQTVTKAGMFAPMLDQAAIKRQRAAVFGAAASATAGQSMIQNAGWAPMQDLGAMASMRANSLQMAAAAAVTKDLHKDGTLQKINADFAAQAQIIKQNSSTWGAFSRAVQESSRSLWTMRRLSYDFEKWGRSMMLTGAATTVAMYSMSNSYVTFDESATRAAMAMRLTTDLTDDLREGVKQASIDVAKFSPEEISEGLRLWAAGTGEVVQSQSQLNRMMDDTVEIQKLAAINNVEFSQTVDDVGGIMHEFGLQTEDVGRVTSVLNYVAAESFANVNDLGQAFKMVGPLANELGISFETTATALAMLADNNVKGTMSGRATRQLLLSMLDPTAKTTKSLNTLFNVNESLGESWRDLVFPNEEFVGLAEMFDILAASTENMTGAQKAELAAVLENANAVPAFVTFLGKQNEARKHGINGMRAYEKVMTGVMDAEVVAYKKMYEATTGLPFSLEGAMAKMTNQWDEWEKGDAARSMRLKQRWHVAILDMGEPLTKFLIPAIEQATSVLEGLAKFAAENPGLLYTILFGAGGSMAIGAGLSAISKGLSAVYLAGTLAPGFKAGWAAYQSGGGQAALAAAVAAGQVPASAAAAVTTTGSVAGVVAGAVPVVLGVLAAAAVVAAIALIAKRITREDRETSERSIENVPEGVQTKFKELFKPNFLGTAYTATSAEGKVLLKAMRDEGLLGPAPAVAAGTLAGETVSLPAEFAAEDLHAVLLRLIDDLGRVNDSGVLRELADARLAGDYKSSRTMRSEEYTAAINAPVAPAFSEDRQAELVSFYGFQTARVKMVADFDAKRRQIQSDYVAWAVQSEQNLNNQLGSLYADHIKSRTRADEDLENSIAEASQSAYRQSEDAAKSHYENLRNMQIAHAQRMVDLLESRDVQGITKEMRSYDTQVDQQNRSFAQQQETSSSDLTERIAKMKEDARLKELRDEEDYNAKAAQMQADFAAEMAAKDAERVAATAELNQQQRDSLQELDDAFYEEIHGLEGLLQTQYGQLNTDLDIFLGTYVGKWVTAADQVNAIMRAMMTGDYEASSRTGGYQMPGGGIEPTNYGASSGAPSRASGGYVGTGLYNLHNGEFVLNPNTTKDLESRYGNLSQRTFNDAMGGQTFVFAPTFNGMGAQDKDWFERAASKVFDMKMSQLRGMVRA